MIVKRAIIDWIDHEEGGPKELPCGVSPLIIYLIAKFKEQDVNDESSTVHWSFLVTLVELLNPRQWLADVQFGVEGAPEEVLTNDAEFELYEGRRHVANGRIVSEDSMNKRDTV